ncbi:MAG: hypothetical protein CL916_07400 [Deltaproteobacteria bacterium]|nr:hypothetical protein [Deltaproteobacteria bacterium]
MFLFLSLIQAQADSILDFNIQYNEVPFTEEKNTRAASQAISKETFVELNIGLASLGSYDFSQGASPGVSLMYGGTYSNSGLVYELQFGAALPTLFTAKIGIGGGSLERNILIAVRPWPFTIGPQLKIEQCTFSFEVGMANGSSYQAGLIGTVGYRWIF